MKHLIFLILISCGNPPTLEDWAKPKMKNYNRSVMCMDLSYRNHCSDGKRFYSDVCKLQYNNCINAKG